MASVLCCSMADAVLLLLTSETLHWCKGHTDVRLETRSWRSLSPWADVGSPEVHTVWTLVFVILRACTRLLLPIRLAMLVAKKPDACPLRKEHLWQKQALQERH